MPTDKRARHKAYRQAKVAELRRAQQRRRTMRRGAVVGVVILAAILLAGLSTLGGHKHKSSTVATKSPKATTAPSTTAPAASAAPLSLAALETHLIARPAPAHSASCSNPTTPTSSTPTTTVPAKGNAVAVIPAPANVGFPELDGSSPHYTKFSSPPPFCINPSDTYTATMRTTAGTMTITLLPKYAPVTVNNFVFLAGYHYFDGIVFHRVIPGFVDQAGDPAGTGTGGPGYTIPDENPKAAAAYDAGALAMANTGQPHSGGSQFFIVVGNGGQQLSPSYAVFGQVTGGLAVADKINAGGSSSGTPTTLYRIESVTVTASPAS